jgi:hypothetical protein
MGVAAGLGFTGYQAYTYIRTAKPKLISDYIYPGLLKFVYKPIFMFNVSCSPNILE